MIKAEKDLIKIVVLLVGGVAELKLKHGNMLSI